ncbi:MAG: hypothetical protein HYV07_22730 [Deltaproteobacteria bacterium]|nr:hypothetical protein [Deltaproteobacteria bacterium]
MSRQFLAGAARLTHAPNVEFVEVVTNASFTEEQLDDFVGRCSVDRLSMWATFHPTQIELDQFLEGVKGASDRGAHVVAHALLFPDTIEVVKELLAACEVLGIRTDVTLGNNFNDAYPGRGPIPMAGRRAEVEALYRSPVALEALGVGLIMPYGERCSAGHDYVRIMENGDVYPCGPYAISRLDRLGSAVDPLFSLVVRETRYRACASGMTCFCKEDYFHLELVRERLRFPRSLGYYETLPEEPATGLHPVAE